MIHGPRGWRPNANRIDFTESRVNINSTRVNWHNPCILNRENKYMMYRNETLPEVKRPKMTQVESIVFHITLLIVLIGPFLLGLYTMYLINTTNFKSIIGL